MTTFHRFGWLAVIVFLSACEQPFATTDEVAVVDLNEIAQVTGQDVAIREQVDGARTELTEQLRTLLARFEQELGAEREALGSKPSDADLQRMQALTMQAQQQMGEAQARAQSQSVQFEAQLAQEFKDKLLPLAQVEAESRGAKIVLTKDAYLFWSADTIDITDAVIAAWNALPSEEAETDVGSAEVESDAGAEATAEPSASEAAPAENVTADPDASADSEATSDADDQPVEPAAAD